MKVDLLFIAAHPDDVELCCAGTIFRHIDQGAKIGIVDLTRGELGSRGNAEIRAQEASKAAEIMGIAFREFLELQDGFFDLTAANKMPVIRAIRRHQPEILITNAIRDRHPDHGRASQLVAEASFLSGLVKIEMEENGVALPAWRPKRVFHMIQDRYITPDICVDIMPYIERKMQAVLAFKSQFYDPYSTEPNTPISGQDFQEFLLARAREMGRLIGVEFAEGYTSEIPVRVDNFLI
ncbi:MAG TPA: bacillithiol biosynthesis deacetylase BshB1 [Saprospiraceae bacterium]|nr:bacillithiol biosynthesis deacetylase BshB1 [Saprospiraceae bacterium]